MQGQAPDLDQPMDPQARPIEVARLPQATARVAGRPALSDRVIVSSREKSVRTIAGLSLLAGLVLVCGSSVSARAPAIESSTWLNTVGGQAPTLVGRPTLVEFWTFG